MIAPTDNLSHQLQPRPQVPLRLLEFTPAGLRTYKAKDQTDHPCRRTSQILQVDLEAQVECLKDLCPHHPSDEAHQLDQPSTIADPGTPLIHYEQ